VSFASTITIGM